MQRKAMAVLVVAASVGAMVGSALAAPGERGDRFAKMKALDTDGDGAVSVDEYLRGLSERFARLDANKDGTLAPGELVKAGKSGAERASRFVKRYDADQDGKVTRAEFEQGRKSWFEKLDKDRDGRIGKSETPAYLLRRGGSGEVPSLAVTLEKAAQRFAAMDSVADGVMDAAEIAAREEAWRDYRVKRAMHRYDADGDGKVTAEEYLAPSRQRFKAMDIDGDGRFGAGDLSPDARQRWVTAAR